MPAPLTDIKQHLRIEHSEEDGILVSLWDAALLKIENLTGRAITPRQDILFLDEFTNPLKLPVSPVQIVNAVEYRDETGAWQAFTGWVLDTREVPATIRLDFGESWPKINPALMSVKITYSVGYTSLPADLLRAALMLVGTWYENREALSETALNRVPMTVDYLLANYKLPRLG